MRFALTIISAVLIVLEALRLASLAHGIGYLWSSKAQTTIAEVEASKSAGVVVDWRAAELVAGHRRLFDSVLTSLKPLWLRALVNAAWRGWIFVVWSAIVCIALGLGRTGIGSIDSWAAVAASGGAVAVSIVLVVHELAKRWKFGDLTEYHWSGAAPGLLTSGVTVKKNAYGVMAVFVLLPGIYLSFLSLIVGLTRADPSLLMNGDSGPSDFLDVLLFTFFAADVSHAARGILLVRGLMYVVLFVDLTVVPALFALTTRD